MLHGYGFGAVWVERDGEDRRIMPVLIRGVSTPREVFRVVVDRERASEAQA